MPYGYYPDPTFLILIPAVILSFIAQMMVNSAFNKYKGWEIIMILEVVL